MPENQAETARSVTDLSPGSGMHFTDPLPRRWPMNNGKRERCVCDADGMCLAHATQRDAAERVANLPAPEGGEG